MPLSKAVPRDHIHTREIKCLGFKRADGLWDIEGSIIDTKTYSFENQDREGVASGEPVHHMIIRLTMDDNLIIQNAEASTISAPYSICPSITPAFEKLKGNQIGPGWRKKVMTLLGKTAGCTHLRDLLIGPVAVTAYQTIIPRKRDNEYEPKPSKSPALLNTCIAFSDKGPIVKKRWPKYYVGRVKNQ